MATSADLTRALLAASNSASLARAYANKAQQDANYIQTLISRLVRTSSSLWKGTWSSGTNYLVNDFVDRSGSTYLSLVTPNQNNLPESSPSEWQLITSSGGSGTIHTSTGLTGDGSTGTPAKLADIPAHAFLVRKTNSTGTPENATPTETTALLDLVTNATKGLMASADKVKLDKVPFLSHNVRFAHPLGSNSNPGTLDFPMKTASFAYNSLGSGISGTIYVAEGTKWSDGTEGLGLVDGQGCWLSNEPITAALPGFLPLKPILIEGYGITQSAQFGTLCVHVPWGKVNADTTRSDPGIWLPACYIGVKFRNLLIIADQPVRLGIDYRRNEDQSITELPITHASRVDGVTTFTVTCPAQPVVSMKRESNVVTVKFATATHNLPRQYCKVHVDAGSHSSDFPTGDFAIPDLGGAGGGFFTFSYPQSGADVPETSTPDATYALSAVVHAEGSQYGVVEIQSTNSEFPSTMYLTGATSNGPFDVKVRDPYGGHHGRTANVSADDIGTMRVQLRYLGCGFEWFDECQFFCTPIGGELFGIGPTIDKGDALGGFQNGQYTNCYLSGAITGGPIAQQELARISNIFSHGIFYSLVHGIQLNLQGGGIYIPSVGYVNLEHVLQDTGIGSDIPTTVTLENGSGMVRLIDIDIADSQLGATPIDIGNIGGQVEIVNSPFKSADSRAFNYIPPPVVGSMESNAQAHWVSRKFTSYEASNIMGWYGNDGRLSGKRIDAQSQFATYQNLGLINLLPEDLTDARWTVSGTTVTPGAEAPDSSNGAFSLTGAGTLTIVGNNCLDLVGPTKIGDRHVFGMWIRSRDRSPIGHIIAQAEYIGTPDYQPFVFYSPFGGDGEWQYMTILGAKVVVPGTDPNGQENRTNLVFTLNVPAGGIDVFQPTLYYLPAERFTLNEQARIYTTMRGAPAYLTASQVGTSPGTRFTAHGGLGFGPEARYVVGAGSGQITFDGSPNGNAVEFFNEFGQTLGAVALTGFTVNNAPAPPLTGLKLWLDASKGAVVETNGTVSSWLDQSGNANDVAQSDPASRPHFRTSVGRKPGLFFNDIPGGGVGNWLEGTTNPLPDNNARSLITVYRPIQSQRFANYGQIMATRRSGTSLNFLAPQRAESTVNFWYTDSNGIGQGRVDTAFAMVDRESYVLEHYWDGNLAHNFADPIINATTHSFQAGATPPVSEVGETAGFFIGAKRTDGYIMSTIGEICEILYYDHVLDGTEQTAVRTYLQNKYGVDLGI